ncbi:MauE/DoxX family redox-associated membrane protein [Arthrobacter sp. GMC3]|uniref:DoxX family protein n=1 Tax=Arthrobacter sp. GMC3 TaxID=2058894 RepID=UPI000CE31459|nr:MauE/DoxX family redox-associated membrane protein [Arthrobacter sp. GMC3]
MNLKTVSVVALATLLGASAINHVRNPKFYYSVVPPSLCTDKDGKFALMSRKQWVLASAVPEVLGAVGLLVPSTRKAAATATALMFAGFTAGHISALQRAFGPKGTPQAKRIHMLRLPLQIPLVAWAWSARKA